MNDRPAPRAESPANEAAPQPASAQRVSMLVGDRLCTHCGYNLTGQAVLREPHYDMLIVRCPECAAVASVQEYPLLGRWAGRWAMILAALWFLFLMLFWVGSGAAIFGISVGAADVAAEDYRNHLEVKFNAWEAETKARLVLALPPGAKALGQQLVLPDDFSYWWASQDPSSLLAEAGGWFGAVDWQALFFWIPLGLLAFMFGCMWATILLARHRPALLLWGGAIMFVAAAFSTIPLSDWLRDDPSWYWAAARRQISPGMLLLSLGFGWAMLATGLMVGRPLVRGMIRVLLLPRMRSSLAMMWIADGLEPPLGQTVSLAPRSPGARG